MEPSIMRLLVRFRGACLTPAIRARRLESSAPPKPQSSLSHSAGTSHHGRLPCCQSMDRRKVHHQVLETAPNRQRKWAPRVRTGCSTCRQRRVKCDERRPTCARCARAGRNCLGYIFNETSVQYSTALAGTQTWRVATTIRTLPRSALFDSSEDMRDILELIPRLNSNIKYSLQSDSTRMRAVAETYLSYLPCRSGRSDALDATTRCVAISVRKLWMQSCQQQIEGAEPHAELCLEKPDGDVLSTYSKALGVLKGALNDPKMVCLPETMCAAALLCYIEAIKEKHEDGMQRHIFGLAEIIKYRTASRFKSDFETCIFLNLLPPIMTQCYYENISCPLSSHKDWVAVLEWEASQRIGTEQERIKFILKSAQVLELLVDCKQLLLREDIQQGDGASRHQQLLRRSKVSRDDFIAWSHAALPSLSQYIQDAEENISSSKHNLMWSYQFLQLTHNRLHVALGGDLAAHVEEESQKLAIELADSVRGRKDEPLFQWPRALTFTVASVLSTANEWLEFVSHGVKAHTGNCRKVASAELYLRWLKSMGIAVT